MGAAGGCNTHRRIKLSSLPQSAPTGSPAMSSIGAAIFGSDQPRHWEEGTQQQLIASSVREVNEAALPDDPQLASACQGGGGDKSQNK